MKKIVLYWFRHDLRLEDNPALNAACRMAKQHAASLLPLFCHTPTWGALQVSYTKWGFERASTHRRQYLRESLIDLRVQLQHYGLDLLELDGELARQINFWAYLKLHYDLQVIVCEDIAAPEELAQIQAVRAMNLPVQASWQSSMYDPAGFDFNVIDMPDQFTAFRQKIEQGNYQVREVVPCELTASLVLDDPGLAQFSANSEGSEVFIDALTDDQVVQDARSSFPYWTQEFKAGSRAAIQHLNQYFSTDLPHHYKQTRNQLFGTEFSTKFSPWLASGALSAPQIVAKLQCFEAEHGQSDSTYWIWFELLWRDYFRFLHCKYGVQLYRASGLSKSPVVLPRFDVQQFEAWTQAKTGQPLVDAAMRELINTGYLSNRLRQQVISYWLHELRGDWRVAAAWLEAQLLDYDVYSNQGNCLYLAGLGTDPRGYVGGRWFDPNKQAKQHDADGRYRTIWNAA